MKSVPLDIVGGTSFDRYRKQSIESTYNMLISDGALVPYAGYKKVATIVEGGEAREIFRSTRFDHLVAVVDDGFYIISTAFGIARVGTLATQTGNVFISENNASQIVAVDGLNVYVYDYVNDVFTTVKVSEDPTAPFNPGYIDFQDTYFIAADLVSNQWRLSKFNDGLVWPSGASNVGMLETKPDLLVATVAFNRQLFVMGQDTTEIWHDVGNTLFPYQRDNSISIDYGCISPQTIASGFGLLVWLAANEKAGPTIVYSTGGKPNTLSTDGINFVLDKLENPEISSAFLFEEDGHIFYQITFPLDEVTYLYDFETNKFFNLSDNCLKAHIAKRVAFFNNTHYFISSTDASIYEMGTQFGTFDGDEIPRLRITKNARLPDASRYIINNVNVTIEQGADDDTQRVDLSLSKNGNASFKNIDGKVLKPLGNHPNKLQWWNLGASNDTSFQFRFWGKERFVVLGGELRIIQ